MIKTELVKYLEATILNPLAERPEIEKLAQEAEVEGYAGLCIYPKWLSEVSSELNLVTVISFPHGLDTTLAKQEAVRKAIDRGAREIDVVMDISALRENDFFRAETDLKAVVQAAAKAPVKAIMETGALNKRQLKEAAKVVESAGASYAKTSTGFGPRGASLEDIEILRNSLSDQVKIKASGGIKDLKFALELISKGADRLGTSSAKAIISEL